MNYSKYVLHTFSNMKVIAASARGQITIPKKIRDKFDTDYFKVSSEGESIVLTPVEPQLKSGLMEELEDAYQDYLQHGGHTWEEVKKMSDALDD